MVLQQRVVKTMACEIVTKTLALIDEYNAMCSAWLAQGVADGITGRTCSITGDLQTLCDSLLLQLYEGTRKIKESEESGGAEDLPDLPEDPATAIITGPWLDDLSTGIVGITETMIIEPDTICSLDLDSSGGDEGFDQTYDADGGGYTIILTYNTYWQKDQVILYDQDETTLFDSGCVGTGGSREEQIAIPNGTTSIRVQVVPNCEGGSGTGWVLSIRCE